MPDTPHILVDLDKTLAYYERWGSPEDIGVPIQPMVDRVKTWLLEGLEVRIFTARVAVDEHEHDLYLRVVAAIQAWCLEHIGQVLPITNYKTLGTLEIFDDRAVGVVPNTGILVGEGSRGLA